MAKSTKLTFCSFCGKSQNEVRKMIAGPGGVYICDSCVNVCKTVIDREVKASQPQETAPFKLLKPNQICSELDQHVIGQEHAKDHATGVQVVTPAASIPDGDTVFDLSKETLHFAVRLQVTDGDLPVDVV